MENQENTSKISHKIKKWRNKFAVVVYDGDSLEQISSFRTSKLNIYTYITTGATVVVILTFVLLKFTPARSLLGYESDPKMNKAIIYNASRVDSLEQQIQIRDNYYENLKKIMKGEVPEGETVDIEETKVNYDDIDFSKSKHDSILRKQIEEDEQYNLSMIEENNRQGNTLQSLHFFAPIKGIITSTFNASEEHYGIDIVAEANKPILTTLNGTVVYAGWTMKTGHVIQVQHENNLLSFYKHNSSLLKKMGDHVKAGESIAIIGNSGEFTTGPHLHFEIWHNGVPLNPQDYIVFQ